MQRRVRLNKVSETFWRRAGEALVQSQVKFNRILENRSGEGLGGFGANPAEVRFNRMAEKISEKAWEASVQSHDRFDRVWEKVMEKVPEKVWDWDILVQSQVRFNRVPEKVPEGFGEEPG